MVFLFFLFLPFWQSQFFRHSFVIHLSVCPKHLSDFMIFFKSAPSNVSCIFLFVLIFRHSSFMRPYIFLAILGSNNLRAFVFPQAIVQVSSFSRCLCFQTLLGFITEK
jgi:hypothetical protein